MLLRPGPSRLCRKCEAISNRKFGFASNTPRKISGRPRAKFISLSSSGCRISWSSNERATQPPWSTSNIQLRWHSKPAAGSKHYREMKLNPDLAYIALGSNVGDKLRNIEDALVALRAAGLEVRRTSGLYETAPMYVENQDSFLNAVCEVVIPSGLSPHDMLTKLKALENELGRVKTIEKGPRSIDLDILLFGQEKVNAPDLVIPHHSMLDREFVLRPLADLIPNKELPNPKKRGKYAAIHWWLNSLPREIDSKVYPLRKTIAHLEPELAARKTRVMAVFNMTPDSFSDGGRNSLDPRDAQVKAALARWKEAGVTIVDVGGQSTRPNAPQVTAEEEISRVIPIIKSIRSQPEFDGIAISIDTFRAPVARTALEAGADIINDVSAGQLDPEMLKTAAALRCPIMLMHMRGDPATMSKMCDYPEGLVTGIAKELTERVHEAETAGIPRWRIILDPGIGFAKKGYQNVEILKKLDELREWPSLQGLPWVVGTSRKKFIGDIISVRAADERDWGTAAAITAAVQGGSDIVRIHNVDLCSTVTMADATYRNTDGKKTLR